MSYCISNIKFWGEGYEQLHEWARNGGEGFFFHRVFNRDVENASYEEQESWEKEYESYNLSDMCCDSKENDNSSISIHLITTGLIPVGVLDKIAKMFPEIHAEGRFAEYSGKFFGNIVIEKGVFLWTNFHNPIKRSGKYFNNKTGEYDYNLFFKEFLEKFINQDIEDFELIDENLKEVIKIMKFDRDHMRHICEYKSNYQYEHYYHITEYEDEDEYWYRHYKIRNCSDFYFSEQELNAISGDLYVQFEMAKEFANSEYPDNNPRIYNISDKNEENSFNRDFYLMSISWLKKAALNGHANAQYRIACQMDNDVDIEEAKNLCLFAIENCSEEAIVDCNNHYNFIHNDAIFKAIKQKAINGSISAKRAIISYFREESHNLNKLPDCYLDGKYVETDTKNSINLHKKSAEKGSPYASFALFKAYLLGLGVEKDLKQAISYLEIAATATNFDEYKDIVSYIDANVYSFLLHNKENELYSFIYKTVEHTDWGDLNSCFLTLILNCYTGEDPIAQSLGISENSQKAIEWLTNAIDMGGSEAYFFIGKMYYEGKFVEQDYKKAFEFFITDKKHDIYERQLRENEELCEYYLGEMYLNGYYVDRSIFKAKEYFKTGAEECSEKCKKLLFLVEKQIKDENFKQNKKELKLINSFEKAVFCQNNDEFLKAIELFINLKNYMDSASRVKELENLCIKEFSEMLSKNKIDKAKDFLNNIPTDTDLYSILSAKINVNDNNAIYGKAKSFFVNRKFEKAIEEFSKIKDWKDSSELIKQAEDELKNQIYTEAKEKLKIRYYRTAIEMLSSILDWKDSSELIKQAEIDLKNRVYDDAKTEFETRNYNRAIELFSSILDWKDSSDLIKQAEDDLKNRVYDDAKTEFETRNYNRAIELFSSIPDWKDSSELIQQAEDEIQNQVYVEAKAELETKNYNRAIELFSSIPNWKDSSELIKQAEDEIQNQVYVEAKAEFSRKHYKRAIILLSSINNWKDSLKVLEEIKNKIYSEGMELIEKDNCSSAVELFELIKDWKDAQSKLEYAKENSKYSVGDEGPAGGTIIYVKDSFSDGWRYIEVGSKVFPKKFFGKMNGFETETEIGSGKSNTLKIVKASKGESTQAKACLEYEQAGYKDWFLPSKDELALFSQLEYIDAKELASSSKNTNLTAWGYEVETKKIKKYNPNLLMRFIPIRYF